MNDKWTMTAEIISVMHLII